MRVVSPVSAQFRQLPMFLAPHEIAGMESGDTSGPMRDWHRDVRDVDDPRHDPDDGSPDRYLRQMSRVVDSQGGIEKPVHARLTMSGDNSILVDGHHRGHLAMQTNRMVPVLWHEGDRRQVEKSAFFGPSSDDQSRGV